MTKAKRGPAAPAAKQQASPYQHVIDILAGGYDAVKIATALAKSHPQLFVDLYKSTCAPPEKWKQEIVSMNYRGEKVPAIKSLREKTGLGLKEAKDIVDNLTVKMHEMGYMISPGSTPNPLTSITQPILNDLADAAYRCK
jgi:Ribosomal protein L7/L12 C-terminal domain